MKSQHLIAIFLVVTAVAACGGQATQTTQPQMSSPPDAGPAIPIPNARTPLPGVLTGGQPSPEHLQQAAQAGYGTVISLRTPGEPGSEGEREATEALGMTFLSIPVAGAEDLTEENARALAAALSAHSGSPLILHCGSGNRAGALLALKAFVVDGSTVQEALALGKAAGLTSLTDAVTERMR